MTIESHRRRTLTVCVAMMVGATLSQSCSERRPPDGGASLTQPVPSTSTGASAGSAATTPPPTPTSGKAAWEARQRAAKPVAPADKLHLLRTTGSVEGPIPYLVVEPADAPPDAPVVLALHGRGDRADAFARLAEQLRLPMRFVVAEAPMVWGARGGRQWFDAKAGDLSGQLDTRIADLVTLAGKVAKRWPAAPMPLLLGFSQGAMLSLQAIAQQPGHFAGAVALSGALLVTDDLPKATVARRVFLTAGSRDRIVRPERARDAAAALEALGHETEVLDFEGGHGVTPDVMAHVRRVLGGWQAGEEVPAAPRAD